MKIRLIERSDIQDKKWNGCVHFSINSFPYAYTWYLDQLALNWFGLVLDDYKAVFPIVWNKKWGIHYIYTPHYIQQLGLFSSIPITENLVQEFLLAIPKKFKYIEIMANANTILEENKSFNQTERINYVLDLKSSYETLKSSFSGNLLRNIKKAEKFGLKITNQIKPEKVVEFYQKTTAKKVKGFNQFYYHALHRLIYKAQFHNVGFCLCALSENDEILATNFFIMNPQRIINLLPSTSEEGRKKGAMHFLLNSLIQQNANKNLKLDFEGSMINSIANFYKSFGAKTEKYVFLKRNSLAFPLNMVKK